MAAWVYILTNQARTVTYIGVTTDLRHRIMNHKNGVGSEFTKKYRVNRLVYTEEYQDVTQAIAREKSLKNWHSQWKHELITRANPEWLDLTLDW